MTRKPKKRRPYRDDRGFLFLADLEQASGPGDVKITVIDRMAPQPGIIGNYWLREALRKFGR